MEGYITGLVGKNGADKSTTIKLSLGLIKPDAGLVLLDGTDSRSLTVADKLQIGVALAESGFSPNLKLKDIGRF